MIEVVVKNRDDCQNLLRYQLVSFLNYEINYTDGQN